MGNSSIDERISGKKPWVVERRERQRFEVDGFAEVVVSDAGFLFRGAIQDLSRSGCYIKTKAYLSVNVGAEVELRFSVNDFHFKTPAKVRLVRRGAGAGFEFLCVEEKVEKGLDGLIAKLSNTTSSVAAKKSG